jgi:hypothetical protein
VRAIRWFDRRAGVALLAVSTLGLTVTACSSAPSKHGPTGPFVASIHPPSVALSVLAGRAGSVAAETARQLFASAPVVVVANAADRRALASAAAEAGQLHAPLFLAWPASGGRAMSMSAAERDEITSLRPRAALAVGCQATALAAVLRKVAVVTNPRKLPRTRSPAPLSKVVLLVHRGDVSAQASVAKATVRAAGSRVVVVDGFDPRTDPAAIRALTAIKPNRVLAVGVKFQPAGRLAGRVAVAETGVQLPGGGQVVFPGRRLVALYGNPESPGLGALGQQDLPASIARARRMAALYRRFGRVPVIPAFEIIASVAQGADAGGTYSYLTPVAQIRPWVVQATRAGMYVILDLQAGRANLIAQARHYRKLLEMPDVGLAIDPEWKLTSRELPLHQIGSVTSSQVNSVASWLAALTARYHLPQKLLVLHQFRLSMLEGEQHIDTGHDDLAIVIHMDGQGTPGNKQSTWDAVIGAAPSRVYFGWKDFFRKDHPMLTPWQTMARTPEPVMISYQ